MEPIPGFAGYLASADGGIVNISTGRTLAQRRAGNGAMQVNIGKTSAMVHNLVARAFYGRPIHRGYRVRHRNGDTTDNSKFNLLWAGRLPFIAQSSPLAPELLAEYERAVFERQSLIELMQT